MGKSGELVRQLRAMAESTSYPAEAEAFHAKAEELTEGHEISTGTNPAGLRLLAAVRSL